MVFLMFSTQYLPLELTKAYPAARPWLKCKLQAFARGEAAKHKGVGGCRNSATVLKRDQRPGLRTEPCSVCGLFTLRD